MLFRSVSKQGYLDYVEDNLYLTNTPKESQYQLLATDLTAGDVNGDGVVDNMDFKLFDDNAAKFEGIYRDLNRLEILAQTNLVGAFPDDRVFHYDSQPTFQEIGQQDGKAWSIWMDLNGDRELDAHEVISDFPLTSGYAYYATSQSPYDKQIGRAACRARVCQYV